MAGKNALVLSGGAVKGCFQAGAVGAVLEAGFVPDVIYGISVGSLNGLYVTKAAALKRQQNGGAPLNGSDWTDISAQLQNYWLSNIRIPQDVAITRGVVGDLLHIAFKNFDGLSDTTPILDKIDQQLENGGLSTVQKSPVQLFVGTVDFISGDIVYKQPSDEDFIDYLKGSLSVPISMPAAHSTHQEVLFDGGMREVAPFSPALNNQAQNLVAILCQAYSVGGPGATWSEHDLMKLIDRFEAIVVNQNIKNDVSWIEYINQVLNEAAAKGVDVSSWDTLKDYKIIAPPLIIRPTAELNIDIQTFTSQDIVTNVKLGYSTAWEIIKTTKPPWYNP